MRVAACLLLILTLMLPAAGEPSWVLIDDFEGRPYAWRAEQGLIPEVTITRQRARSGKRALAVTTLRQTENMVRASWMTRLEGITLSPESRLRFRIYGSRRAQRPHGGLILIEAGGRQGGGDSHWMADIPAEVYARERWQTVTLPPVREFRQPSWSVDADGRIDLTRVSQLLFVAQQESEPRLARPFTFYFDDLEATHVTELKPTVVPATHEEKPARIRPKLRGFVDRERAHPAQVTFADLSGWEVYCHGGMKATLERSEEEPLFERYSARLTYSSADGSGWIALRPQQPVPIQGAFNAVQLWVFGNNWAWVPDPSTPPVEIAVTVRDATGEEHRVSLGTVNWKFWGVLHKLIGADTTEDVSHHAWGGDRDGRLDFPAAFTGIEIRNCGNREPRVLYFESVAFYQEEAPKLTYQPIPERLPFPTTPDTILPSVLAPVRNTLRQEGNAYVFTCAGEGEPLEYRYVPETGSLSDLTCRRGEVSFRPAEGAGLWWQVGKELILPTDNRLRHRLLAATVEGETLTTRWRWSLGRQRLEFTLTLRAKGNSLIHEWRCEKPEVAQLSLGRATGLVDGKVFRVPYYTVMGQGGAGILYDRGLFASHLIDWYVTECSQFYGGIAETSPQEVSYTGGAYYIPKTDGTRNPLYERCFLTVSPHFEDVLPNLPNPPTPLTAVLREYLYTHLGGIAPDRFDTWLRQLREYRKYGIDKLLVTQHEDSWTQGGDVGQGPEEYTMTTEGPPDVGGDAKMLEYYAAVKALGYYVGPYNNYTDYSPLGKSWAEENVTRLPNGEWHRAWPPTYSIRPLKAAEMAAYYAPAQVRKFGVNTTYCDVHTCVPPWGYVDYQAGHPGAAKMRTTFEAYGRILRLQREAYGGPCFSEGVHHCFYAGLIDGSYAQMGLPDPAGQPLLLDFDLRKIHPLSADISMLPAAYWSENEYHCMAATIAYGHIGFFPFSNVAQSCRYFYLMQALQRRYVQVPVRDIGYWDGQEFLGISQALPRGVNARGQVRVRYENGLEVWVNYHPRDRWQVQVGGTDYDLGPYAWVARDPSGFLEYSTDVEGRRVNFVQSPEFLFADAGGKLHDFGPVATDGEVVLKNEGPTGKRLIAIVPGTRLSLAGSWTRCTARDGEEKVLGMTTLAPDGQGRRAIPLAPGALYYDLE